MLKQSVTYTDFDDNVVTETLYFNISMAEATRMQTDGTFDALKALIESDQSDKNGLRVLEKFIALAYGEQTTNGRRFHKDAQQSEDFLSSPAYDALFRKMLEGGGDMVATFITGILPTEFAQQIAAQMAGQTGVKVDIPAQPVTTTQGIQVNSLKLPDPPKAAEPQDTVPPAFQNKMAERAQRARQHGLRPQPPEPTPTTVVETPKPINEMTDAELEAELAKRKSN